MTSSATPRIETPPGRTAVITGASRGLGQLSAVELTRRGWHVVAAMRRPDRDGPALTAACAGLRGTLELLELDLIDRSSIEAAAEKLGARRMDALVHVAGIAPAMAFEDTPYQDQISTLQTNLLGPMNLTALVLPSMRERGTGRIVAVSSLAGRLGLPLSSVYGASKAGLTKWIESLAAEVHQFGLSAHILEAGMFETDMVLNATVPDAVGPYGAMYATFAKRQPGVVARAKPAARFVKVLADTVELPSPPVLRMVGSDALAAYHAQRIIPARLISTVLRRVCTP